MRLTWQKSFNVWSPYKQNTGQGYKNILVVCNKWHSLALMADAYIGEQEKSTLDLSGGWMTK